MNFKSDLIEIVKHYFAKEGVSFKGMVDASDFAARFCEMQIRRIVPKPRRVHFSRELHRSLGKLAREKDKDKRDSALEARGTVFHIRSLFENGKKVTPYLSKGVNYSTSKDGLLWDYGMHHLHLSRKLDKSGFVERSDYLLFAIVSEADVFLVDIRMHRDSENLQWVRQDLLKIVHSNWPDITNSHVLHGVRGDIVTDEEKYVLRKKNINFIPNLEEQAVAPLSLGINIAGYSTFCRIWGDKLLWEIKRHEDYFYRQPSELRADLEGKGVELPGDMEFQLVLLDSLNPPDEVVALLTADHCLSSDLCRMGFTIVEATKRLPIVVSLVDQP